MFFLFSILILTVYFALFSKLFFRFVLFTIQQQENQQDSRGKWIGMDDKSGTSENPFEIYLVERDLLHNMFKIHKYIRFNTVAQCSCELSCVLNLTSSVSITID